MLGAVGSVMHNLVLFMSANMNHQKMVRTAADESEVRGYIFRVLEPHGNLAPLD